MKTALAFQRAPRGAASVEMAVCMLVIVPVFLYALFLDDLLRYSLDVQEATVSTVWDYTVEDFSQSSEDKVAAVQRHARLMFCDHESGKGRYDVMGPMGNYLDCEGEDHHRGTAVSAHVCWINDQAKQVTCTGPDRSVGKLSGNDKLYTGYADKFNQGGLVHCSARAVVENYLLPKHFLSKFSDDRGAVDLTKKRWVGGSYHDNSKLGDKDTAYFIKEQEMSILVDTWALTQPADVRPGKKEGELYNRVVNLYTNDGANPGFAQVKRQLLSFNNQLKSLIASGSLPKSGGDDPGTPNLAIKPHLQGLATPSERIRQETGNAYYFNTEWRDWEQDRNRKTYEKRGEHYLGCKKLEEC